MIRRPEWDLDRPYGEEGEGVVRRVLALPEARVEVKRKRRCDDKFYVETYQSPFATGDYRPSGINVTTSEYWAYLIADTGVIVLVPTATLKAAARSAKAAQEHTGDNPTKGRLVSFPDVLAVALPPNEAVA